MSLIHIRVAQNDDDSDFSDDDTEAMEFDDSGELIVGGDDEINFKDSDGNNDYDPGYSRGSTGESESVNFT